MNPFLQYNAIFFACGLLLLIVSIVFHVLEKEKPAFFFLVLSSFFLFLFGAFLFDFLNIWDERFHALVGKNLMYHPLKPTLYDDPVVLMQYTWWDKAHIWLHKQPFSLWQIALSYKILGVNVYALRLPSVILSTLLVCIAYRCGKIVGNKNIGYYTGLLFLSSPYLILLVSGYAQLDHNDVSFLAYISFSIWAWLEYRRSNNKWWLLLIGVFSGFAILTKWLVGLLIYLIWGIESIYKNKFQLKKYGDVLLALIITVVIALPWQLFVLYAYPEDAKAEHQYNFDHLFIPLEGHGGGLDYHFNQIKLLFGRFVPILIIPALVVFYFKIPDKKLYGALLLSSILVFLFFTFTATKMPSFTLVIALPVFISLAFLINYLLGLFNKLGIPRVLKKCLIAVFLLALAIWRIDIPTLQKKHGFFGKQDECSQLLAKNTRIFQKLQLPSNAILFNLKGRHNIEAMFFTGLPAYNFIPTEEQYLDLKNKNRLVAIFKGPNDSIPAFLLKDPQLILIHQEMKGCD